MTNNNTIIKNLVSGEALEKELRFRKQSAIYLTVPKDQEENYIAQGWSQVRENIKSVRLEKPKPVGQALEDRTWSMLAKMGFIEMNGPGNFEIPVSKSGKEVPPKQVDVFARDENSVLIIECKEAAAPTKRSLQKDIAETYSNKEAMFQVLRKHYEREKKFKVAWVYVTKNIIWSKPDLERAADTDIHLIRDDDLEYYEQLVGLIKSAARYQILADIFRFQKIPGLSLNVPAVQGKMGGANFIPLLLILLDF